MLAESQTRPVSNRVDSQHHVLVQLEHGRALKAIEAHTLARV